MNKNNVDCIRYNNMPVFNAKTEPCREAAVEANNLEHDHFRALDKVMPREAGASYLDQQAVETFF